MLEFGGKGHFFWKNQLLRLTRWHPNFSTQKLTQSNALVWIKFLGLPMEYWEPRSLMALGRAIGRPLHIDNTIVYWESGYCAMVLCDVDLAKEHPNRILIEVEDLDIKFWPRIKFACLLDFCTHCKSIGHLLPDWRLWRTYHRNQRQISLLLQRRHRKLCQSSKDTGKIKKLLLALWWERTRCNKLKEKVMK